jgi:hypothetical protein
MVSPLAIENDAAEATALGSAAKPVPAAPATAPNAVNEPLAV